MIRGIELLHPAMLVLAGLATIPLILWRRARRNHYALSLHLGGGSPPKPPVLLVLAMLLLAFAASGPYTRYYEEIKLSNASIEKVNKVPIDVVVAIDVSKSMSYSDHGLKRMNLAKAFVEKLAERIGSARLVILAFSSTTRLVYEGAPSNATGVVEGLVANEKYSAIGDALAAAASYLRAARRPGAVIILTDGGWNYGSDPVQVAKELGSSRIPVLFVIIGDDPRGAKLAARLRSNGVHVYSLNEVTAKVLDSLVEEASRDTRLQALRMAGVTSIRLPVGEEDLSWITGLAAVALLVARLLIEP